MSSGNNQRDLSSPEVRRDTFNSYAKSYPAIEKLVEAGFYYLGVEDECQCYLCAVRLFNWEIDDDPMKEHRKYRPDCEIFNLVKTPEKSVFTSPVHESPHHISKPAHAFNPEKCYTPQAGTVIPDGIPNNYKTVLTQAHTDSSSMILSPPIAYRENPFPHHDPHPYYPTRPTGTTETQPPPPPLPPRNPYRYSSGPYSSATVYHPQTYPQLRPNRYNHYPPTATNMFMSHNHSSSPHYAAYPRSINPLYAPPIHVNPRFSYPYRL